jgi:hypothetical protein
MMMMMMGVGPCAEIGSLLTVSFFEDVMLDMPIHRYSVLFSLFL